MVHPIALKRIRRNFLRPAAVFHPVQSDGSSMRIFALFLCMFLMLITLGTLTYVYILWNTYWIRVAKLTEEGGYLRKQTAVRIVEVDPQVSHATFQMVLRTVVVHCIK